MKDLIKLLSEKARWCIDHDDDSVNGVYAVPGPHRRGDEAADEPVLAAEILDEIRPSLLPSVPADEGGEADVEHAPSRNRGVN